MKYKPLIIVSGEPYSTFLEIFYKIFKSTFYKKYKIQVPFIKWQDKTFFRISLQVYNSKEDIYYLIKSLKEFIK